MVSGRGSEGLGDGWKGNEGLGSQQEMVGEKVKVWVVIGTWLERE